MSPRGQMRDREPILLRPETWARLRRLRGADRRRVFVVLLMLAACTNSSSEAVDSIPQTTGAGDVVVQVGSYDLGVVPDMFVFGPEVLIYGDRSVYAENARGTVTGSIDEPDLQDLLREADTLPTTTPVGEAPSDGVPLVLAIGSHVWKINDQTVEPFASYLAKIRTAVDLAADRVWAPARFVSRPYGAATCDVTIESAGNGSYEAPVYPHVLEQFPLGPVDCTSHGATVLTVELSCLDTHVWMMNADQTLAVGLVLAAKGPGTFEFDVGRMEAYRGAEVRGSACNGGKDDRPAERRLDVVSGSGTLILDSEEFSGQGDRLTTSELRLSDGTVIAPFDVVLGCAGCLPT